MSPWRFQAKRIPVRVKKTPKNRAFAADMPTPTNPIQRSFELAAERCEDLTPAVYRRLFREHPEAEAMFRREAGDLVKGSMLALAIDAIMDFAGDRRGSFRMIECEVQSHDAYGTPRELFGEFFGVIADTMREILGADWSPEIEHAWRELLGELDRVVADPDRIGPAVDAIPNT
jgi:hemoglobin-like flavoprotein